METTLLSAIPLICVLVTLVYVVVVGDRLHGRTSAVSGFAIAATLFGLLVGFLLERFFPPERSMDDWTNYRVLKIEVALLFVFVSAISFLAVTQLRRDLLGATPAAKGPRKFALVGVLFLLAVGISARGNVAAILVNLLQKVNL
jgi:MFS family permease